MAEPIPPFHPCPACGFLVFPRTFGSGETCRVCGWVDDYVQLVHPDLAIGANSGFSLREAQRAALRAHPLAVAASGAIPRDSRWRPLAPGEDPRSGPEELASPVCYLGTPDPETFDPYWLRPPEPGPGR